MSERWIDGFVGIGQTCFEKTAKEFVEISNGTCVLDHSSPEAFRASHGEGGIGACVYTPTEAIAWRVVGVTKTKDPIIAYTYRGVKAENLEPAREFSSFSINSFRRSRMAGRV